MFAEDDRVAIAQRGSQKSFGVGRIRCCHDFEAWYVGKYWIQGLCMLGCGAESTANDGTNDHWDGGFAAEHIAYLGGLVEQRVHTTSDEAAEHQLGNGYHTGSGSANGGADKG